MMRKRLVSLLLVMMMCLGLVTPVAAAEPAGYFIIRTYERPGDIAGTNAVYPLDQSASGEGWRYDAATGVVTLDGFHCPGVSLLYQPAEWWPHQTFVIDLAEGSANVLNDEAGNSTMLYNGRKEDENPTDRIEIRGGGTLEVGPFDAKNMTLDGCTVNVHAASGGNVEMDDSLVLKNGAVLTISSRAIYFGDIVIPPDQAAREREVLSPRIEDGAVVYQVTAADSFYTFMERDPFAEMDRYSITDVKGEPLTRTRTQPEGTMSPRYTFTNGAGDVETTVVFSNGTFTLPAELTGMPEPVEPPPSATPTASTVQVDGKTVNFDAYNIGGANYFKLRDLAYVLNGTQKQFAVEWDASANAISLISGQPYEPVGGEMTAGSGGNQSPVRTTSKILLNGAAVSMEAYNIGGNNYFKLRDVGVALNFGVDWDAGANTVIINTSKGYTPVV